MAENENTPAAEIVAEALALNAQKALDEAVDKYHAAFGPAGLAIKAVQVATATLMGLVGYDSGDDDAKLKKIISEMVDKSIQRLDATLEEAISKAPPNIPVPEDAIRRLAAIKAKQGVKLNGQSG